MAVLKKTYSMFTLFANNLDDLGFWHALVTIQKSKLSDYREGNLSCFESTKIGGLFTVRVFRRSNALLWNT